MTNQFEAPLPQGSQEKPKEEPVRKNIERPDADEREREKALKILAEKAEPRDRDPERGYRPGQIENQIKKILEFVTTLSEEEKERISDIASRITEAEESIERGDAGGEGRLEEANKELLAVVDDLKNAK